MPFTDCRTSTGELTTPHTRCLGLLSVRLVVGVGSATQVCH